MTLSNFFAQADFNYLMALGVLAFIVLFVVFFILSVVFIRILLNASTLHDKSSKLYKEAEASLESARKQAFNLIVDANKQAERILEDVGQVSDELVDTFDGHVDNLASKSTEVLQDATDSILRAHHKALLQTSKENLATLKEASSEAEKELRKDVTDFRKNLLAIEDEYRKQVMAELNDYKHKKEAQLDSALREILANVSMRVFGKVLDLQEHQELITDALANAKASGLFDSFVPEVSNSTKQS